MTRNEQTREKFLEVLAEKPFINYACAKIGISRSTIYRWMKDNYRFKRKVLKAITNGRENVTEIAETALVKEVSRGNMRAIEFFLKYNSKRYSRHADPVETEPEKEDLSAPFRRPDGRILVSKDTAELIEKQHKEERKRKSRALGFTDLD